MSLVPLEESVGTIRWPDVAAVNSSLLTLATGDSNDGNLGRLGVWVSHQVLIAQEILIVLLLRHHRGADITLLTQFIRIGVNHGVHAGKWHVSEIRKVLADRHIQRVGPVEDIWIRLQVTSSTRGLFAGEGVDGIKCVQTSS